MEGVLRKMKKFEYPHRVEGNAVYTDLGTSQEISLTYSEKGTIKIKDTLKSWNPLTGIIQLSVKGSIVFNIIGIFIILIMFAFADRQKSSNSYMLISIGLISWIVMWNSYYLVKAENFKRQLMDWIEQLES